VEKPTAALSRNSPRAASIGVDKAAVAAPIMLER